MIDVIGPLNSGLTAGGAGTSTNNATSTFKVKGELLGFFVKFNDTPPATTDVTIQATEGVMPTRTILTLTNVNTDGFYPVRLGALTVAGAAITDSHVPAVLCDDKIKVTVAQANDNDSVDIYTVVRR